MDTFKQEFSLTSAISHSPPKFPDVRNFSDLVGHIVRLPFLAFYCCLQFIFDADLYLVKRPMIGQSKMYWTAYQTLLIFCDVW